MTNRSDHIDEKTMGLFVLGAKEIAAERGSIRRHLRSCKGCSSLYKEMSDYYSDFEKLQKQSIKTDAIAPMEQLIARRTDQLVKAPQRTTLAKIPIFFRQHPFGSSAGIVVVLLAVVMYVRTDWATEKRLAYARAKNEYLIAYNETGKELWRKHIGVGYDFTQLYNPGFRERSELYLKTIDVDGDGHKEIVATFGDHIDHDSQLTRTILCLNNDGSERWRYEFHRKMTFGEETFSDDYVAGIMMAGDFDKDGSAEIIAVIKHRPFYSTAVVKLDAKSGKFLSEYWHSGYLHTVEHRDIDGDDIEELLFGGENNGYNLAALLVLDPRNLSGHAPAPPNYTPLSIASGLEKYYLLFPRTDLAKFSTYKRNVVSAISYTEERLVRLNAAEHVAGEAVAVHFLLDSTMTCVKVENTDYFESLHSRLESEGKLTRRIDSQYYEELRRNIHYWDGEKFTETPTMNKKSLKMAQK